MKKVKGTINGIAITLHVPETLPEFKEGARNSGGYLLENEGYLFNFRKAMQIKMENSGVQQELALLYMHPFTKYGVVEELKFMKENSSTRITSYGFYQIAIELRGDFVRNNHIEPNAILILNEELK
jgi:hypothetical protein